jgi:hypothetical protein
LDALYAKRGQITMPMTHGFGDIENKLTAGPTHYIQRFEVILLHIESFVPKRRIFAVTSPKLCAFGCAWGARMTAPVERRCGDRTLCCEMMALETQILSHQQADPKSCLTKKQDTDDT